MTSTKAIVEEYAKHDGVGLAILMKSDEIGAMEVMEAAIELSHRLDAELNFLAVDCADIGREYARGPLPSSPLAGVPYLLKDAFTSWAGTVTTSGCKLFAGVISQTDSETVRRAKAAGLWLFGKSTTPEWGWALSTETLLHGDTRNPWDITRTPGGSSGGAAAAVASGAVPLANSSDGGGSTRIPAAYCGLVGLKASRGRISAGPDVIDMTAGMAQEGCVSRTVRDQAAYLDIMHGQLMGERDRMPRLERSFSAALRSPRRPLHIGVTTRSLSHVQTYSAGVAGVEKAVKLCEQLGHHIDEVSFSGFDYVQAYSHARAIYGLGHLGVLRQARELKGAEPSGDDFMRFMFESARSSAAMTAYEYLMHTEGIRIAGREIETACSPFDLVLTPMSIIPPPKIGQNHMRDTELEEYHAALRDYGMVFSIPFNISGQPACSVPIDVDAEGLPVGLQIVGPWGDEATVLALAAEIEEASPWIGRHPPIWAA
jgi:amidase